MSYIKINPRWLKNLNVKNKVVRTKKKGGGDIKKKSSHKEGPARQGTKTKCHKLKYKIKARRTDTFA